MITADETEVTTLRSELLGSFAGNVEQAKWWAEGYLNYLRRQIATPYGIAEDAAREQWNRELRLFEGIAATL